MLGWHGLLDYSRYLRFPEAPSEQLIVERKLLNVQMGLRELQSEQLNVEEELGVLQSEELKVQTDCSTPRTPSA
ncbi:MAG: hypothetical protein USCAAHI_00306 [Beijerinckiaceae bacterium]|nr:MAG: hypothetical protein USCAAHI_00306 [Beijerinckiaceae bacterium]